jgi:hypothetical protein
MGHLAHGDPRVPLEQPDSGTLTPQQFEATRTALGAIGWQDPDHGDPGQ